MTSRIIYTILAPTLVCFLAWLGGFDFDTRGPGAFYVGTWSLFACLAAWSYPGYTK